MIESPGYTLSVYGVSEKVGFLADEFPLQRLPDPYFEPWERVMDNLPMLTNSLSLRGKIEELPEMHTIRLHTETEWKRAYVVFSFLTHGYIWAGQHPSERLPPSLTLPFSKIADHFALPATATYAGLNLWNWKPVEHLADLTIPENLEILNTFTGTTDEAWFYLISVSIEAKGGSAIPVMLELTEAVRVENVRMVIECLKQIATCLKDMDVLLDRMHEKCDPAIFYHRVRPFLAGSKGMAGAGLPNGIFYDEGNDQGRWRQYSGGSNAQSSLIQLFDVVLGVDHRAQDGPGSKAKEKYLLEMRNYMPGTHRHFLSHVTSIANLKEYIRRPGCEMGVRIAYQAALESLTAFRDTHLRIVARYIVAPAQQPKSSTPVRHVNAASFSSHSPKTQGAERLLSGTGGTALIPFLKQTRDETKCAVNFDVLEKRGPSNLA